MGDATRPVTVSIVSHRHWESIQPLLRQLNAHCADSIERVVLTINVPELVRIDGDLRFPVEVIRNPRPRGFGANHNSAFAGVATPWFLVLNPDIRIDDDVIGKLLRAAQPEAALLAPRVQEPDADGPEPFRTLTTPWRIFKRFILRLRNDPPPPVPSWVAGMFMLLRSDAYRRMRGFDERFFMYCEDVDLSMRLQLADWKLQVASDLIVHHEAQRDSHSSMRAFLWHFGSLIKLWFSRDLWRFRRVEQRWLRSAQEPSVLVTAVRAGLQPQAPAPDAPAPQQVRAAKRHRA